MTTTRTLPVVDVYDASDYAGLRVGDRDFYYGYEFGRTEGGEDIYGFAYTFDGVEEIRLPYSDMARFVGCPDEADCLSCLLFGIGLVLMDEERDMPARACRPPAIGEG